MSYLTRPFFYDQSTPVKSLIICHNCKFIFVCSFVMCSNNISLCKWRYVSYVSLSFPCRIPNIRRTRVSSRGNNIGATKKKISCSLDTITRLAIRQRSSAHVNPFKATRARLYVAASRKKGASPPSQTTSSPPFVFMPAFHFLSFFSLFSFFLFYSRVHVPSRSSFSHFSRTEKL